MNNAGMVELVDTADSKSADYSHVGSTPATGTTKEIKAMYTLQTQGFGEGVELQAEASINKTEALTKGLNSLVLFDVFRLTATSRHRVGRFYLAGLPGCCGVVVSCHSFLEPISRSTAVGPWFHILKEEVAKDLGYSLMLSTTDMTNVPQVVSASKAGWKFLEFFTNKRTYNKIGLAVKKI